MGKTAAPKAELEKKSGIRRILKTVKSRIKRTGKRAKSGIKRMEKKVQKIFRTKGKRVAPEQDLREDKDVDDLQKRTETIMHALANDVQVNSLSLASLKEVTTCLLQMDQEVMKIIEKYIEEYKEDIRSKPKLSKLVQDYFDLDTLNLYNEMKTCLKKTMEDQHIIQNAMMQFPAKGERQPREEECLKVLEELRKFKSVGSTFAENFWRPFESVCGQHIYMLETFGAQRNKLNKKLKDARAWRKISSIIFVAIFGTVLICSVVAAAIAAPHVAAVLSAAAAIPMMSMSKWVNSLWKKYEDTIKCQKQVINVMTIKDLDTVISLVESLQGTILSMQRSAEFCLGDSGALPFGNDDIKKKEQSFMNHIDDLFQQVEDIKKKQQSFIKGIKDLFQDVDSCSCYIAQARTKVIKMMGPIDDLFQYVDCSSCYNGQARTNMGPSIKRSSSF